MLELSSLTFLVRKIFAFLSFAISIRTSDLLIWVISISQTRPSVWCHTIIINTNSFCFTNLIYLSCNFSFSIYTVYEYCSRRAVDTIFINGNLSSIIHKITNLQAKLNLSIWRLTQNSFLLLHHWWFRLFRHSSSDYDQGKKKLCAEN